MKGQPDKRGHAVATPRGRKDTKSVGLVGELAQELASGSTSVIRETLCGASVLSSMLCDLYPFYKTRQVRKRSCGMLARDRPNCACMHAPADRITAAAVALAFSTMDAWHLTAERRPLLVKARGALGVTRSDCILVSVEQVRATSKSSVVTVCKQPLCYKLRRTKRVSSPALDWRLWPCHPP